jgi:hypothetical protein
MRDRGGSFDPQTIPKGQTRFDGFDEILDVRARVAQFRPAVDARMSVEAPPCWAPARAKAPSRRLLAKCWATSLASILARPCRIKQIVLDARVRRIELVVREIGAQLRLGRQPDHFRTQPGPHAVPSNFHLRRVVAFLNILANRVWRTQKKIVPHPKPLRRDT